MFSSFFHPEKAYQKAEDQSQQYYRDAQGNLQPYNQNGMDQYGRLTNQANALNNPAELENQWANSYQESPYAKAMEGHAKEAGLGAASSMGLNGSSAALNNIQQSSHDIMNQDRQQFMQDLMQKFMASIGIGQNLYGVGANAANQMSNNAIDEGNTMAGLAYGKQAAPGSMFGNLLGKGLDLGLNYATGGLSGLTKEISNMTTGGG